MYDLVVAGGTVVDPAQRLNRRADVAVLGGRVAAVEPTIERSQAKTVLDATGLIVTPGLVDLHVHVYPGVSHYGIDADQDVLRGGVTTAVDAGSAGASTFGGLRRHVLNNSSMRLFAFLNISGMGMIKEGIGDLEDLRWADVPAAVQTCLQNRDVIVGIKIRLTRNLVGENALPALRKAREAADAAGLRLMVHPNEPVCSLDDVMALLKEGDLVTHCFHGRGEAIVDAGGQVRKSVREAIDRGVLLDVGHGSGSFAFDVAEKALAQGVLPATISSDLHFYSIKGPAYDLATTISKFLFLGCELSDAVSRSTAAPAEVLGLRGQIGTLAPGAHADIAVFDLREGRHVFVDAERQTRTADRRLVPVKVVKAGKVTDAVARP